VGLWVQRDVADALWAVGDGSLSAQKELLDAGQKNPGNAVTQDMKWEIKSSRQLSMHVSPTTMLNGLVYETSSSWTLEQWRELLEPVLIA
jgi:hypothetical protein